MTNITTIGLDLAKSVFQVHGADRDGGPVLRRKLRRSQVLGSCLSALIRPHRNALWISRRYPNVRDASRDAVAWFSQDVA